MNKKEMAEVFADFVKEHKEYYGKSEKKIFNILREKYKNIEWDDEESPLPQVASDTFRILDEFYGKGPEEIESDLELLSTFEIEDFHIIAKKLSFLPDEVLTPIKIKINSQGGKEKEK